MPFPNWNENQFVALFFEYLLFQNLAPNQLPLPGEVLIALGLDNQVKSFRMVIIIELGFFEIFRKKIYENI